jgi:hypothetical protein
MLEAGISKIRMPADSVSSEISLSSPKMLHSCFILIGGRGKPTLYKDANLMI